MNLNAIPSVRLTFHGVTPSKAMNDEILTRAAKLLRYSSDIKSCRVTVERPHLHHEEDNRYSVRVDLSVPGGAVGATSEGNLRRRVVNEAFDAVRRRLQDHMRRRQRAVKNHSRPASRAKLLRRG
jgi:ribosome-associated translation inhibitor RaiA